MIIYVDIDDTICYYKEGNKGDYKLAIPCKERIEKINDLFDQGAEIHFWTARGTGTGINWEEITKNQLKLWNCKYHSLKFNKPIYDLFIDDKNINSEEYFKNINSFPNPSP